MGRFAWVWVVPVVFGGTGCHQLCGDNRGPIWVQADCALVDTGGDACELSLAATVNGASSASVAAGSEVTLQAVITNVSGGDLTVLLPDPCPDGEAVFDGLGADYDYYGTCADGECRESGQVELSIVAGESHLVEVVVDLGATTCNEAVPAGNYELTFSLPAVDVRQCGSGVARLEVR